MSELIIEYNYAITRVFWDVEDYPIPNGLDPLSMKEKIESVLASVGYRGDVSIHAYVDKNTFSDDELLRNFSDAGIKIDLLPEGDKNAKVYSMLVGIYLWTFINRLPANLIVFSKNIELEDQIDMFEGFYLKGFGIVLSDVEPDWLPPNKRPPRF